MRVDVMRQRVIRNTDARDRKPVWLAINPHIASDNNVVEITTES
jgi:hypothetical protein